MATDWMLVATVATPVACLFLGAWLQRVSEKKVKLAAFYAHANQFQAQPTSGVAYRVHSHSVVVRNAGGLPATNVRIPHLALPGHDGTPGGYDMWRPRQHTVAPLRGGGAEILIPVLEPGGETTITYLYFPPLVFGQIHLPISCDQGGATHLNMQLRLQPARWEVVAHKTYLAAATVAVLYFVAQVGIGVLH